jgi:autotransporter-associated beta strand protein
VIELAADGAGGVIESSGTGTLIFDAAAFTVGAVGNEDKTLTLGGTNTDANEIQSVIADGSVPLNLEKTGSGMWIVSAANTYTGDKTILEGTLLVNNTSDSGTGDGNVLVESGATLGGTGTISGSVMAANPGARISPGVGIGLFIVGNLGLQDSSSQLAIDIGGITPGSEHDLLLVNNVATLSGELLVSLEGFLPNSTDAFTIVTALFINLGFSNLSSNRVNTVGGEGSFLVTEDTFLSSQIVVLSDFQATPLAAATAASELIDAALAVWLADETTDPDEPLVDDQLSPLDATTDAAIETRPTKFSAPDHDEFDIASSRSDLDDESEEGWLSESLLEQVFS